MISVLYQDDAIIVAIKPAGILSQESADGKDSLPLRLKQQSGGDIRCVHRLDRETAGVMVFARGKAAAAELSRLIAEQQFEKEYLLLTQKAPNPPNGTMEDLLFFDRQKNKVFPVKRKRGGVKSAFLSYETLAVKDGVVLIKAMPKTGRTHQIRVQFASRQMPLVGDRKYGGNGNDLALFCSSLSFCHPITKTAMKFSAQPESKGMWELMQTEISALVLK